MVGCNVEQLFGLKWLLFLILFHYHFDNDEPGRIAGDRLQTELGQKQIKNVLQYSSKKTPKLSYNECG